MHSPELGAMSSAIHSPLAGLEGTKLALDREATRLATVAVMRNTCWTLKNLACLVDNQARIAAAGGIAAVVRVMGEHQADAAVMEHACGALGIIGWSDEALQKRIKDAGAEPLVRAAVAASDATDATKKHGQKLLNKLGKV